jgi:hypothetical protein
MKKYLNILVVSAIPFLLGMVSCSKSSYNSNTNTNNAVTAELTAGKWVISSFTQKTEDKTSKFSGITFVFSSDGSVSADDNGKTTKGSWHYSPAVTYYGSSSKEALSINLGTAKPFDLLAKTWNLVSSSSTAIKVDSPEVLEDEHVQFSKQ